MEREVPLHLQQFRLSKDPKAVSKGKTGVCWGVTQETVISTTIYRAPITYQTLCGTSDTHHLLDPNHSPRGSILLFPFHRWEG